MMQQHKADLDSHKLSLAASKEEVEQLRRELTKKRTSVSHLLGTVRSATAQVRNGEQVYVCACVCVHMCVDRQVSNSAVIFRKLRKE